MTLVDSEIYEQRHNICPYKQQNKCYLGNLTKNSCLENVRMQCKSEANYSLIPSSFAIMDMDTRENTLLGCYQQFSDHFLSIGSWGQESFQVANSNYLLLSRLFIFFCCFLCFLKIHYFLSIFYQFYSSHLHFYMLVFTSTFMFKTCILCILYVQLSLALSVPWQVYT